MAKNTAAGSRDLLPFVVKILDERHEQYKQRFDGQQQALANALAQTERAVDKAELAMESRLNSLNEFRGTLTTQQSTYITRAEVETRLRLIDERITSVTSTSDRSEGKGSGLNAALGYVIALGALAFAAFNFFASR